MFIALCIDPFPPGERGGGQFSNSKILKALDRFLPEQPCTVAPRSVDTGFRTPWHTFSQRASRRTLCRSSYTDFQEYLYTPLPS